MSVNPKKFKEFSYHYMEAVKAGAIALSALRHIQRMDDLYKRNKAVVKIANSLQKGISGLLSRYGKHYNIAYDIEQKTAQESSDLLVYTHGTNLMIEPVSYIMYILYDREEDLKKHFKINYTYVGKLENITLQDKSIEVKYLRNAGIYLDEYLRLLDFRIRRIKNDIGREAYKIEKGLK